MENILVSACLLGVQCRYDGKCVPNETVIALKEHYNLIPVCGEIMGGMTTPRPASEIVGDKVMSIDNVDVTDNFMRGAEQVLHLAKMFNCKKAVLKERSPSCGSGTIYDGTFSGNLTNGDGMTAKLLKQNGIEIYGETAVNKLV